MNCLWFLSARLGRTKGVPLARVLVDLGCFEEEVLWGPTVGMAEGVKSTDKGPFRQQWWTTDIAAGKGYLLCPG